MNAPPAEMWRPIAGFPLHEVSNRGRVRTRSQGRGLRIMRSSLDRDGYPVVDIQHRHRISTVRIHRLVGEAFLGPLPAGKVTRHLNGDPTNNALENLAYGTPRENAEDTLRHGRNRNSAKTHCRRDHPYDEENTYWYAGGRYCRACNREAARRTKARRQVAS